MTEVVKEVIMLAREMLQTWKQQQEFLLESFSEHMTLGKKAMLDSFDLKFQTLAKAIEGYESHIPDDQTPGPSQPTVFSQSSTNRYRRQEASQAYDSYGGFLQNNYAGSYGGAYGSGQFFGSYGSQYYPPQFSRASTFTQMGNKANMFGKGQGKIGTAGKVQKLLVKKSSTQQGGLMEGGSATSQSTYEQDIERKEKYSSKFGIAITGGDILSKQLRELAPDGNVKPEHLLLCRKCASLGHQSKNCTKQSLTSDNSAIRKMERLMSLYKINQRWNLPDNNKIWNLLKVDSMNT